MRDHFSTFWICINVDAYDYWKEKFKDRPKLEVYQRLSPEKTSQETARNGITPPAGVAIPTTATASPTSWPPASTKPQRNTSPATNFAPTTPTAPPTWIKYTYAACVLTENGFMDSPVSLAFLEYDEGKKAIISLHVDGIIDFIQQRANEPL